VKPAAARAGISDILISNEIVDRFALAELAEVARLARVTVAVDHIRHVELLDDLAGQAKVTVGVVIELDVGSGRCGLPAGSSDLLPLARAVEAAEGLRFRGLQAYEGHAVLREDRALRRTLVWQAALQTAHERDRLASAGFGCVLICGGGTGTYDLIAEAGVHNEVQAGSYVLMDATYRDRRAVRDRPVLRSICDQPA
jgi:D-serine deaminase-like pyridoxal phosphate-dependent protein